MLNQLISNTDWNKHFHEYVCRENACSFFKPEDMNASSATFDVHKNYNIDIVILSANLVCMPFSASYLVNSLVKLTAKTLNWCT